MLRPTRDPSPAPKQDARRFPARVARSRPSSSQTDPEPRTRTMDDGGDKQEGGS